MYLLLKLQHLGKGPKMCTCTLEKGVNGKGYVELEKTFGLGSIISKQEWQALQYSETIWDN